MSEKERMLTGRLYLAFDEELCQDNKKARMLTRLLNSSTEEQNDYRKTLLKQLFKSTGENIYIEPPFRTDNPAKIIREITRDDREKWMALAEQYRKEIQSEKKDQ